MFSWLCRKLLVKYNNTASWKKSFSSNLWITHKKIVQVTEYSKLTDELSMKD